MAGLKGNVAWWAIAKQSAKGSIAAYAPSKIPFTGGGLAVTRETANLSETDSSRDQGISYVSRSGVEGSVESYVRDSYVHNLLESVLGNRSVVASGTSFTVSSATAAAPVSATVNAVSNVLNVYTYTTAAAHGFAIGDTVVIAGSSVTGWNGTYSITSVPTTTTFTVNGATSAGYGATTWSSGTATSIKSIYTYTTSAAHGYTAGTSVGVSGAANAAYNGLFLVLSAPTTTTFTVAGQASPGTTTFTSGTVSAAGTHTITPANGLPYYTFWRNQSDVLWESFQDCMVGELTIKGEAGAPLSASASVMGLTPTRSTAETSATSWNTKIANDACYNYNDAQVAIGGTVGSTGLITSPTITSLVRSVEVQITNNLNVQQTDDVTPYDMVPGTREINISFDLILDTLDEYNKFFYGGASGTSASSSIYTTPMQIKFTKSATSNITLDFPSVAYEAFPVQPNPNGDPIVVSVRAQAQRTGDVLKPIMTATVVNANLL
jgi:hypothetical protein